MAVEDASGNVETGDNATKVTLAIGTNPGGGTLTGGAAVTVASGIATFAGLSINKAGTGYTLTATSSPAYTAATSSAFNITAGVATQLAFVQGPSTAPAGTAIAPEVTVAVEDANGNVETGDHSTTVSLAIGTNPGGGTLTGGSAVASCPGHRDLPRPFDRQGRDRLHPGRVQHAFVHGGHLVTLQHHPGRPHAAGIRPGPDEHGRRLGHHSVGDRRRRGRQRQCRDG